MKHLLHILDKFFSIIIIIFEIAEFLFIPAILTIIGLFNSLPWQYYPISIGIYIVLYILTELLAHFTFKALEKKYTPLIERILNNIFNKCEKNKISKE